MMQTNQQPRTSLKPWLIAVAVIIVLDQISKTFFHLFYDEFERTSILPFLDFTLMFNRGAAFSLLANESGWQRWFFTAVGLISTIVITWMLHKNRDNKLYSLSLSLILGGALGNVIDRILFGHVVDFILVHWNELWFFPAFNLADSAITAGVIGLILNEILTKRRHAREQA